MSKKNNSNIIENKYILATNKDATNPQLLSKLFPQTAVTDQTELEQQQEKQRQQEEGWKIFPKSIVNNN
jgi:hypothetical protein